MNPKALLVSCLLLVGCGSEGGKDYSIKVYAVNVDCEFAEQVTTEASQRFYAAGIPFVISEFNCVTWEKTYEFGETARALSELSSAFGAGHYIVPKFGNYFDGVANVNSSVSVAVIGRLVDSSEQMSHEIAHTFGASHDFSNCNLMGYRRCGYPAEFNEKAIKEMT